MDKCWRLPEHSTNPFLGAENYLVSNLSSSLSPTLKTPIPSWAVLAQEKTLLHTQLAEGAFTSVASSGFILSALYSPLEVIRIGISSPD